MKMIEMKRKKLYINKNNDEEKVLPFFAKVRKVGPTSLIITIPKKIVELKNLKEGEIVELYLVGNDDEQ